MTNHLIRLLLDLIHTAYYICLLHVGYNITDQLIDGKKDVLGYVIIWVLAAAIIFFLTKERYDKETQEGKGDEK